MSHIVEPDDFAIGREEERNAKATEVERTIGDSLRVTLGLLQDALRS